MKIGLIDVDGHNFPNLALMKISAYHKMRGDTVEFYSPLLSDEMDKVYMSKVFTFSPDYSDIIKSKEIIKGGTGYYYPDGGEPLPDEIEHIMPDYSLYGIKDTAYGFLTRGCPRKCGFCIVSKKEGQKSIKVADTAEFWSGQKEIVLLDPNILACEDHIRLLDDLQKTGAAIDFTQGLDARLLTPEIAKLLKNIKIKMIHFAIDDYVTRNVIIEKLNMFKNITGMTKQNVSVYVLCNYNTTIEQDLERINKIREIGFNPYVMLYEKENIAKGHPLLHLQRWTNNKYIFNAEKDFYKYKANGGY